MHVPLTDSSLRIAVVEDDRDFRELILAYLRCQGYAAWGAESAEALYRRMQAEPADIVVLDIGLPGEDGLSVAQRLRGSPSLGIIIVSGYDTREARLAGLKAGADYYLVKPVDMDELVADIEALARRRDPGA